MEKDGEDHRKAKKVGWIVNQTPTLGLEHDKIWAQWVSNIMLKACWQGMMVQMFQDEILKSNHVLFDKLFKGMKTHTH